MRNSRLSRRDFLKLLGLAPLSGLRLPDLPALPPPSHPAGGTTPNILILVFDALSARHLSLYGYPRRTSPNLERLADRATVFHRHYAAGNFTTPGVASLLSGLYPWSHRALSPGGTALPPFPDHNLFSLLHPHFKTIAYTHNSNVSVFLDQARRHIDEWLPTYKLCLASIDYSDLYFQNDFLTAANAQNLILWRAPQPTSSFLISRFNRLRAYYYYMRLNRRYGKLYPRGLPRVGITFFTIEQTLDWVLTQARQQSRPYLGYVHLLPPHFPYTTRAEFFNRFADGWTPPFKPDHFFAKYPAPFIDAQRQYYDEAVAYVDAEFGRLFDALDESGALQDTCLIFTSDHGEMLERGILAHETPVLYEEIIRVPLLIWQPGQSHRQDIHVPTSAVDLLPTLLSFAGQPIPEWCEGGLLPTSSAAVPDHPQFVVEAKENAQHAPLHKVTLAMIKGRYKLIYYLGYKGYSDIFEMYDLQEDPQELLDIYPASPIAAEMKSELLAKLDQVNALKANP